MKFIDYVVIAVISFSVCFTVSFLGGKLIYSLGSSPLEQYEEQSK